VPGLASGIPDATSPFRVTLRKVTVDGASEDPGGELSASPMLTTRIVVACGWLREMRLGHAIDPRAASVVIVEVAGFG